MAFAALGLDPKLLKALSRKQLKQPTPVQESCIAKALEGKDIVARARTGSGKTLAYVLPILHKLLLTSPEQQTASWQALILVPTRELCEQVKEETESILASGIAGVSVTALTETGLRQRDQLLRAGPIVVATPGRIAQALKEGTLRSQVLQPNKKQRRPGLTSLVIDEADLILSMPGYTEDLQEIAPKIPRGCQCMLMSATTNESVEQLQKLVLHNPVTLDLLSSQPEPTAAQGIADSIEHFKIHCAREDKLLYVMALLKLGLVKRKVLLFVNTVEAAYRLRLFLESFGIRSAAISAELPMNSRHHILQEFNKGIFDYLIATDQPGKHSQEMQNSGSVPGKRGTKRRRIAADEEFGVTRGVDFKGVETVINVEPPASIPSYVHRVGRTGRAGKFGTAVSLFCPEDTAFEAELARQLSEPPPTTSGEAPAPKEGLLEFSRLPKAVVEGLRYRAEDVARSLTSKVVREARTKELRLELLNSQRLETHFQEHPGDLALLQHDKPLAKKPDAPHLKHLPPYLQAAGLALAPLKGGRLAVSKQRKRNKSIDPIKGGFLSAPKRGEAAEPLTDMELKAEEYGKKLEKQERKKQHITGFLPKKNVRKKR